jgi:hypothetical protein
MGVFSLTALSGLRAKEPRGGPWSFILVEQPRDLAKSNWYNYDGIYLVWYVLCVH